MLRLLLLLLIAILAVSCYPTDNGLLIRLKRVPYNAPPDNSEEQPFWPPPPPFWAPPFWRQNQEASQSYKDNDFRDSIADQPCSGCKGGAVSTSQSDTGDAISVAIARS
ncbi:unnamed protein product [Pieris macdunnoughi]|uniref:Uncharacterized protein n=1 Tax=Pieris macdunnoughi TaxID=345717 RepID=A0A821XUQ1_9NEOP|nr:unnamed protein product [Pieris macdunnoughi]